MKKRLIAVVVAVCALAVLAIGSTFAFFTSKDNAGNTFTMGNVAITLTETSPAGDGLKTGIVAEGNQAIEYENALPGDTFSKKPVVTNTGDNTAWIRVEVKVKPAEGQELTENAAKYLADLEKQIIDDMTKSGNWFTKDNDGYIYYKNALADEAEAVLFETVSIPTSWGNDAANLKFTIDISAQAVQADNNGTTWNTASWLDFDGE